MDTCETSDTQDTVRIQADVAPVRFKGCGRGGAPRLGKVGQPLERGGQPLNDVERQAEKKFLHLPARKEIFERQFLIGGKYLVGRCVTSIHGRDVSRGHLLKLKLGRR